MHDRSAREQKYVTMLEAIIDLGTEFNGIADLQRHYKDEVQRHTTRLDTNKKYTSLFNSYAQGKEKEDAFALKMLCDDNAMSTEKSTLKSFALGAKIIGSVLYFLPTAYQQRKREEKLVEIAYAP
jgi:hypothetical protein